MNDLIVCEAVMYGGPDDGSKYQFDKVINTGQMIHQRIYCTSKYHRYQFDGDVTKSGELKFIYKGVV